VDLTLAVRLAVGADIPRIIQMVEALRAEIGGPLVVDTAWTGGQVARLIGADDGAVWISRSGFLAAEIGPSIISPLPVAHEHGWWADDGQGLRLLRAYEQWARQKGVALVHLSTGAFGPDLTRLGYRAAERHWVKAI
jgi:hypothetical protein